MTDPKVALMKLIANSWDASATSVDIDFPTEHGDRFSITEDGHGMKTLGISRLRIKEIIGTR